MCVLVELRTPYPANHAVRDNANPKFKRNGSDTTRKEVLWAPPSTKDYSDPGSPMTETESLKRRP